MLRVKKIKVIIVDDEGLVRAGIAKLIETMSEDVVVCGEAEDGEAAKELIRSVCPQLVFTDIVMPRVDGIELLKWILSFDSKIVSVVLSSYKDFDYVKRAFLFGASNYILKHEIDKDGMRPILDEAVRQIKGQMDPEQYDQQSIIKEFIYSKTQCVPGNSIIVMQIPGEADGNIKLKELLAAGIAESANITFYYGDSPKIYGYGKTEQVALLVCQLRNKAISAGIRLITGRSDGSEGDNIATQKRNADCALDRFFFNNAEKDTVFSNEWAAQNVKVHQSEEMLMDAVIGTNTQNPKTELKNLCVIMRGCHTLTAVKAKLIFISVIEMLDLKFPDFFKNNKLDAGTIGVSLLGIDKLDECEEAMSTLIDRVIDGSIELHGLRDASKPVKAAALYINRNYSDCGLNVNMIANEIKYSSTYVSRQFKIECGINLVDYITKVRLQNAKILLDRGETKLFRVAESVGFSNYNYFSKVFKKVIGCSPSEYKDGKRAE
jgi:two-component system response regulator YesN